MQQQHNQINQQLEPFSGLHVSNGPNTASTSPSTATVTPAPYSHASSDPPTITATTDSPTVSATSQTVCQAFAQLYQDFISSPPSQDVVWLRADADAVIHVALIVGDPNVSIDDANNLAAYVSASDFAQNWSVMGDAVQKIYNECPR